MIDNYDKSMLLQYVEALSREIARNKSKVIKGLRK